MAEGFEGGQVPRVRVYWDAFEATELVGVFIPSKIRALIKLAFFCGAHATITFRRIVNSDVPDNAKNVVLQGYCDDVQYQIRGARRYFENAPGFPAPIAFSDPKRRIRSSYKEPKEPKPPKPLSVVTKKGIRNIGF